MRTLLKSKNNNLRNNSGFSLTEMVIVVFVASLIFLAVFQFGDFIFSFNSSAEKNLSAQNSARRVLKVMVRELRSASPSSVGGYPLATVGTSTLVFYSNIDSDQYKERIRYFLDGNELKKGVLKPSGTPLYYNPANEQVYSLVKYINNGIDPIFEYYDNTYTGTSTPLLQPVQATRVRLVKILLKIEKDPNKSMGPLIVETQVFLRNLKDNL